ncbi:hypothetical protein TSUD_404960 [Trifolium subterraneum]|uniref:CCHC-type domain-containing protein n=1 Tax=Trifolium subterraneum TaxID=3900 RepID=A0A2Z6NV73_TRISU|nr:hypothetical protein TSUD_404960 [Trifolium subterraneum]
MDRWAIQILRREDLLCLLRRSTRHLLLVFRVRRRVAILVSSLVHLLWTMTSARANAQIAESLATLTHLLARGDDPARDGEKRLDRFLKHKPSFFVGGFNPDGAVKWVEEVEIIFDAMECANENKLPLGTYMLREEANQWWKNAKLRIGDRGVVITWEMFKREFFNKYFPADVKNKKVVEFMKLEQGNMSVAEYAAKFESLCAFSPHYNTPEAENDKCVKFESGLRPDIKHIIGFAEIRNFTTLVAKARICDEDGKAKSNYFKAVRGKSQDRAKPYEVKGRGNARGGKGKEKVDGDKCYRCGKIGHRSFECKKDKDLFIPQEAQQILNIPITDRSQEDTLTWDGTIDGNYTIKSGNAASFQDKILTLIEVFSIALAQLQEGTLKINVDAHLSSDGSWFTGMVLRQLDGSAVGAVTRAHIVGTK